MLGSAVEAIWTGNLQLAYRLCMWKPGWNCLHIMAWLAHTRQDVEIAGKPT